MPRSELDLAAELAALGRPDLPIDITDRKAIEHRAEVLAAWDAAHPAAAARWVSLRAELETVTADAAKVVDRARSAARDGDQVLRRTVGARIADALISPLETAPLTAAREWAQATAWSLLLLGTRGNGKSVAAGWLVQQALARGESAEWLRAQEVEALRGARAHELRARCRRIDLLVIDDYGDEPDSQPWKAWLRDVLGARYSNVLRTVITSNLDRQHFKGRVGVRLTDRFREGAVVSFNQPSMRQSPSEASR